MEPEEVPPAPRVCARHGHAKGHDGTCIVCDLPLEPPETEPANANAAFDAAIDRKMADFKFIEVVVGAGD